MKRQVEFKFPRNDGILPCIQIAEPIFVCEAALRPDFLCFILDATRIQVREIAIEMLFFLFILKKLSFAFVLCLLMS